VLCFIPSRNRRSQKRGRFGFDDLIKTQDPRVRCGVEYSRDGRSSLLEAKPGHGPRALREKVRSVPRVPSLSEAVLWPLFAAGFCPKCKTTMKIVDKVVRPEEIEFFLRLHDLWEGILAIPPPPDPPFDVETLDADSILVLNAEYPVQDDFPEFVYD
jgi:hypothetical protein